MSALKRISIASLSILREVRELPSDLDPKDRLCRFEERIFLKGAKTTGEKSLALRPEKSADFSAKDVPYFNYIENIIEMDIR